MLLPDGALAALVFAALRLPATARADWSPESRPRIAPPEGATLR
jgi:hypothetical protein